MIVRPQVIKVMVEERSVPRYELAMYGVQLVSRGNVIWAKKAAWFRNVPFTAVNPTKKQAAVRVRFGELAKEAAKLSPEEIASRVGGKVITTATGKKLIELPDGRVLPVVAAYIYAMRGEIAAAASRYESGRVGRRSYHTLEELKQILAKG